MMISELIKKERLARGWSQEDLAKKLMISRQSISKWELGTALPNTEQLIKLSDVFGLSLDVLIKGDEKMEKKVIKDSKMMWWNDDCARPIMLIIWGAIIPLLCVMKYVLHIF
ncbi:helix-turn-helix transcriptional regulator [Vagococcus coleopterorum]|uniref:Helix-turn-helix transcriptional regulator n=1 Tax=Vagococcus coleopterorum TaxID=2714946 RepID=A0A6G8ALF7_9ENTE|nr:helix-turn-helix transcriptional regulator [Vagococcus coleopterorum]QIL45836.1 helix-turn-helix transcriptional regulator [Vagococcus coleopterorum]